MQFTIRERIIQCTDERLIGDNADYSASFTFDSEWDGKVKTARFQHVNKGIYCDVILQDDACTIPAAILKAGFVRIGVFTDAMTSTHCEIKVVESIKEKNGSPAAPSYDVYAQIISMIENNAGGSGTNGRDGVDGKDGVNGIDGKDGVDGKDGINGVDGKDGKDGVDGITYTPVIGTVTTLAAGSNATASVNVSGTTATFNFGIPKGADGQNGSGSASSGTTTIVTGEDYQKRILNFPIRLRDLPKVQGGLFTTKTRYVTETVTDIPSPVIEPSVVDGVVNPKLLHVIGERSYRIVSDPDNAWYIKNDNGFTAGGGTLDLSFGFDGDKFEMFICSFTHIRVYLDDGSGFVVHSADEQYILKGSYGRLRNVALTIDFGSAKPRNIIIECGSGDLFGGFIHSKQYSIYPFVEKRPLGMFIGSSLTDGSALGVGQQNTWNKYVCRRLGINWINLGQGATGFLNSADHLEGRDRVRGRMGLVYPHKPWLLTLEGSYNDMGGGHSVQELKDELDLLFAEVNANIPECLTIVIGTLTPCRDKKADGHWDAKNDALREKALEYHLPFIDVLNGKVYNSQGMLVSESESWLYGSGNTSDPKGDGNCDIYIGSDAVHPNAAGHRYLGDRILDAIVDIITAERVTSSIPANNFNLDKNMISLTVGDTRTLTYFPTSATPTFSVVGGAATVASDGTVTAIASGVAMVTATFNGVSDTCLVNVGSSDSGDSGDSGGSDDSGDSGSGSGDSGSDSGDSGGSSSGGTDDGINYPADLKTAPYWFAYRGTGDVIYCGNYTKNLGTAKVSSSTKMLVFTGAAGMGVINGWKSSDEGMTWTKTVDNETLPTLADPNGTTTIKTANGSSSTYNFDSKYGHRVLWVEDSGNFTVDNSTFTV